MGSVLRGIASGYSCGRCLKVWEDKNMHALIEDRETPYQNLDFGISIKNWTYMGLPVIQNLRYGSSVGRNR